jgi:two-component system, NtrC family, sensor kinase
MTIRWKLILLLSSTFTLFVALSRIVYSKVVTPSFDNLERQEATKDLQRCTDAMHREVIQLSIFLRTWAAWDDCYQYAVDHNDAFIKSNCPPETYTNNNLNLIWIADTTGKIIWGETRDDHDGTLFDLGSFSPAVLNAHHPLIEFNDPRAVTGGIVMTGLGPMYIVAEPIVNSHNQGPIHGSIMMGRLLRQEERQLLVDQTHVNFQLWSLNDPTIPDTAKQAAINLKPNTPLLRDFSDQTLYAYTILPDIYGRPSLILQASIPKSISADGQTAGRVAFASNIAGGAFIMLTLGLVLGHTVSRPLRQLSGHMSRVGESGDLKTQLNMRRSDEIGELANDFDEMVRALSDFRAKLQTTSRQAGMAEVATGVLHNVGNLLNSINTGAVVIREKIDKSRFPTHLAKASAMMQEHRDTIGDFLTADPKGTQIIDYLARMAELMAGDRQLLGAELAQLCTGVEHIRQIVHAQQAFARPAKQYEQVDLSELVEEAIRLNVDSLPGDNITIERQFDASPQVTVDRHNVVQILVNLLTNARNAILEHPTEQRQITVRISSKPVDSVLMSQIAVVDTGIGIAPENMNKLFRYGFTTRAQGHGFGLHSAANAAREMGGALSASSPGVGAGATFTLEIPNNPIEEITPAEVGR